MRETRALRRAAWRELWPAAFLVLGCAVAIAYAIATENQPAPIWLGLWLAPMALFCGTACGRASTRTLAYFLARPVRRERLLDSRLVLALAVVAAAWLIVALAIALRAPRAIAWNDAVLVLGMLVLALMCGALGATATDRESLALGIATLVYASLFVVPLMATDALDITFTRALHAGGAGVMLALVVGAIGLVRALRRAWREGPPACVRRTVRPLATASAGSWALGMALTVATIWWSASAARAVPLIVIGVGADGIVVASGSPAGLDGSVGARVDTIHFGLTDPDVALEVERGSDGVVTDAIQVGGRTVVQVSRHAGATCEVMSLGGSTEGPRLLDVQCGRMWASPSGRSLAITSASRLTLFDLDAHAVRLRDDGWYEGGVVGWLDDSPVLASFDPACSEVARIAGVPAKARRSSPDGRRVAASIVTSVTGERERVEVLELDDESVVTLVPDARRVTLLGWLGDGHVAVVVADPTPMLSVFDATTGDVVAGPVRAPMLSSAIDGPVLGPWLVTQGHGAVTAVQGDGTELWSEPFGKFDRDDASVRRWAIVDHEIVGIDPGGRPWRRPLPWEVTL